MSCRTKGYISQLIIPLARQYICPTCEASIETLLLESMSEHNIALNLEGECCYHMALDNSGKLLGVIGMRQETHLFHLFVADGYQGQGIARQLWHYVKSDTLNRLGGTQFTVNSALNAEQVYRQFGFERIGGIRQRGGMVDVPMLLSASQAESTTL
ncbi:GNAT family N-acetyltransferase [Vibrio ostreicida]|uniref:GNAT family N-acetyltransferase n=1 Tax=Vibrio ostreicida TaxID=526588 RepID=UPI0009713D5A|nr:GNAT family N-acetyltransferase [Vibrio ostreicida]